jgi:hypothetical protein
MENSTRVIGQPALHLRVHVGGVVVQDAMDDSARRNGALDGVDEPDELLMTVPAHAVANHGAVQHVQGREQGGAVALVIVGRGSAFPRLQRQSRLGAVERLDLRFLVDRYDRRVGGSSRGR